jgi:hypothetical protein
MSVAALVIWNKPSSWMVGYTEVIQFDGLSFNWRTDSNEKENASNVWPPEMALSIGRYKPTIHSETATFR